LARGDGQIRGRNDKEDLSSYNLMPPSFSFGSIPLASVL
jgi:hypothetical protein